MTKLIDSHVPLDYPQFAPDFDDVQGRADEAGVTRIVTIGTSIESSRRAVELAENSRDPRSENRQWLLRM